jgi:hypothetical protein
MSEESEVAVLLDLIVEADDQLLSEGRHIATRQLLVPSRVMAALGHRSFDKSGPFEPEIHKRIRYLHRELNSGWSLASTHLHGGVFLFRDTPLFFYIPLIFGKIAIKPLQHLAASDLQVQWLSRSSEVVEEYTSQYASVFDFLAALGTSEDHSCFLGRAYDLARKAQFHIVAAAAIICSPVFTSGSVQSSILSCELALKARLSSLGASDQDLKIIGHDLSKLTIELWKRLPDINLQKLNALVKNLPNLVENRYSSVNVGREECARIAMNSQLVLGEVARTFKKDSILNSLL